MRLLGNINCQLRLLLAFASIFAACLGLSGCSATLLPVQPTILVSSSQSPSSYGQAVTFTAAIPEGQGGVVTFFDNGNPIGSGLVQDGIASLTSTSLSHGSHSIVASWSGGGIFKAASSQALSQIVQSAVPDVSWNAPPALVYGNPLGSGQLDANSSVIGTLEYSPAAGTILGIGSNTLSVTFTPLDTADYTSVTSSVQLSVVPPSMSLSTQSTLVLEGTSVPLTATLNGPNEPIEWAVNGIIGGATNIGTISPNGTYTAPNIPNITVTVSAFLQADPADQQSTQITIIGAQATPGGIGFAFILPISAATSAGVYDASGNLVRTLWSNRPYLAGTQAESWDGSDDSGSPVPVGSYQIRVLYNNVTYTWGEIGNTSASWTSANSWDMQSSLPVDVANVNGIAYTANQYGEIAPNISSFALSTPQAPTGLFSAKYCWEYHFIAADSNLVYLANNGNGSTGAVAFIAAWDPQSNQFYSFPSGETYDNTPYGSASCIGTYPTNVIDYQAPTSQGQTGPGRQNIPSGIAVQTNGNLLAVSHGAYGVLPSLDVIRLFDKRSGVLLGNVTIPNPQRLAFAPNGDLWAISNNSVVRIASVGAINSIATTLPNLSSPISVAVDPTTSDVLVTDGGSSQQVKRFSQSGQLISTYGDVGGYTDCSPTVTPSRLFLDETAGVGYVGATTFNPSAFITVLPDSSFWFGDPGNARLLHISSTGTYIEQISYLRWLYQVAADHSNPTRVFADDLEYSVDYTQPLVPGDPDPSLGGNGSWKLVRNWWACLPTNYANAIDQVQTFPNGHTYALIGNSNDDAYDELAELPDSGPIRFSGQLIGYTGPFQSRVSPYFTHGGNLGSWFLDSSQVNELAVEQNLVGYDASNWPMWGLQNVIASTPWGQDTDPYGWFGWGMAFWPEATSNGEVVTYNTSPSSTPGEDHHIGGVMLGGTNWSWRASPGALIRIPDGQGTFSDYQSFGGHNGIAALVEGSNIIQGYDGQNSTFSSQWMHWNQDGLLIGQFGHPYGLNPEGGMSAGAAGNIEKMSTVSANGNVYLYNSDESLHPGIHQWRISNLGSIHELMGSASLGGTVILQ